MPVTDPAAFLRALFDAALSAAGPEGNFGALPPEPEGRLVVIGAGKGSARMAAAFEAEVEKAGWTTKPEGLIVTRYGHACPTRHVEVVEASHPVPDAAGEVAARRILHLAEGAGEKDLVVALISGGASALLALPVSPATLADKQQVGRALLKSGAPIDEMNRVRQALSGIKGGRLAAAAAPARLVTWMISDVPGDEPAVIGSGPTVALPDGESPEAILERRGVQIGDALRGVIADNPAPKEVSGELRMLATPQMALEAAAEAARAAGVTPMILGDAIEGEAREAAQVMAGITRQVLRHGQPLPRPCVLLSGGETTVTVRGQGGRGGRNAEFLLALAVALGADMAGVHALAADTDGIDGSEDNAGAIIGPDTHARAGEAGVSLRALLDGNDAYSAFEALGDLVVTGPTLTNVNDFRAIYLP
ncbi:glycerate kinase type-2 family protein [Rhodovulum sp. DZ06]|uniref:glycerate kinase type-2 family protein n=1 Tax=Rhodovulum sp. DZ06 TaxID=3425126 RepID=UPI003D3350B4